MTLFLLIETPSSPFGHRYLVAPGRTVGDLVAARYTGCVREGYPLSGKDWIGASVAVTQAAFSGGREAVIKAVAFGTVVETATPETREALASGLQRIISQLPDFLMGFDWSGAKERLVVELPGLEVFFDSFDHLDEAVRLNQTHDGERTRSLKRIVSFALCLLVASLLAIALVMPKRDTSADSESFDSEHLTDVSAKEAPPLTADNGKSKVVVSSDQKAKEDHAIPSSKTTEDKPEPDGTIADDATTETKTHVPVDIPPPVLQQILKPFPAVPDVEEPFITAFLTESNLLLGKAAQLIQTSTTPQHPSDSDYLQRHSELMRKFFTERYTSENAIQLICSDFTLLSMDSDGNKTEAADLPKNLQTHIFGSEQEYFEQIHEWLDQAMERRKSELDDKMLKLSYSAPDGAWMFLLASSEGDGNSDRKNREADTTQLIASLKAFVKDLDDLRKVEFSKAIQSFDNKVQNLQTQRETSRALLLQLSNSKKNAPWRVSWSTPGKTEKFVIGEKAGAIGVTISDKSDGTLSLNSAVVLLQNSPSVAIPIEVDKSTPEAIDGTRKHFRGTMKFERPTDSRETKPANQAFLRCDLLRKPSDKGNELRAETTVFNMSWLRPARAFAKE